MRFIDDNLVDADLGNGQKIVLEGGKRLEPFLQALLQSLQPLAGNAILIIELHQKILIELQFVMDHLLFEGGGHSYELERRMGDDDRIPDKRLPHG